ncbi:PREDICTED: uncharacterized protein LOC106752326 [Dinoponera quadriceps]|uniref:Uncharacterized protein LOC106752326 n=1 Tax=Dinoponera quadriceps TaxID=609295 RepID=A0A6P3YHZ3_DINQU|nr:PREDICTED: uncharacterized protein LOC106752326 [Dinoponera quadriceps]
MKCKTVWQISMKLVKVGATVYKELPAAKFYFLLPVNPDKKCCLRIVRYEIESPDAYYRTHIMKRAICKYISACFLFVCNGRAEETQHTFVSKETDSYGLSEGPFWDATTQNLYFVDIYNQYIRRLNYQTGLVTSAYIANGTVGVVAPVEGTSEQLVAGVGQDLVMVYWNGEQTQTDVPIEKLSSVDSGISTRINDGKIDSSGRFWLGTRGEDKNGDSIPNIGSLYIIDKNFMVEEKISPVTTSNGLIWNIEDDTFYYIDSPTRQIAAYDYKSCSGEISNRRIVFDFNAANIPGEPDGMTIDINGNLWVAVFGGGCVPVYIGSVKPLVNNYKFDNYFGEDGFGDFNFTQEIITKVDETKRAPVVLVDLVKKYPGEVTIVTLGPLTNIAVASALEPRFLCYTKQLIIMGSSVQSESDESLKLEFNFEQDPESNWITFNSTNKVHTLFPIDTVRSHPISKDEHKMIFNKLKASFAKFLYLAERVAFEKQEFWEPSDAMAMTIMLKPEIVKKSFETTLVPVLVGDARGAVIVDSNNTAHNARIIQDFDLIAFKNLISECLS